MLKVTIKIITWSYPIIFLLTKHIPYHSFLSFVIILLSILNIVVCIKSKTLNHNIVIPVIFFIIAIITFFSPLEVIYKSIPFILSIYFFLLFFFSNFTDKTLIEQFATMFNKKCNYDLKCYLKKLNWAWTCVLLLNTLLNYIVLFMPLKYWVIYTTFFSYILLGTFFLIEYVFRKVLWRRRYIN